MYDKNTIEYSCNMYLGDHIRFQKMKNLFIVYSKVRPILIYDGENLKHILCIWKTTFYESIAFIKVFSLKN